MNRWWMALTGALGADAVLLVLMWMLPAPACWGAGVGAAVASLAAVIIAWGMPTDRRGNRS